MDFFPDSRSLFVCGNEHGRAGRCYRSPLDASSLQPVTPDSIRGGLLRPDGLAVLARRLDGFWVYQLDGSSPRPVPGLGDTVAVLRWSPDGKAFWVQAGAELSPRVDRVDAETGRRSTLVTIEPPVGVPLFQIFGLSLADDPRVYAYSAWSYSSELFTV